MTFEKTGQITADGTVNTKAKFEFSSYQNSTCFPKNFVVDLEFPAQDSFSGISVTNFVTALMIVCMFFIYEMLSQIKLATDHNLVASRLSLFTLSFNTTWNFCYFNLFLRYAL
jgi:hypothetical protein